MRLSKPSSSRLLAEDGHLRLEVGRLDIGDEAPFEAGAESVFQGRNLFRRRVGREYDLLLRLVKGVKRVKELLLRPFLPGQELDVVEQKGVDLSIAVAKLLHPVVANRRDQLGHKRVG